MKNILILGGGFAGVTTGLTLTKCLKKEEAKITLVDENSFHVFYPSLYEVATAEEPQKNVAIPYKDIFSNKLNLIRSKITSIDVNNHKVILTGNHAVDWDYLAICLGSEINYFSIPGLEKHAIALNTLDDAVKIKHELEKRVVQKIAEGKQAEIIVGGGGFSGTELSAEIANFRNKLAKANRNASKLINVTILESKEGILSGLGAKISSLVQKRLNSFKVNVKTGCFITNVENNFLETSDGQKYPFDILIWTGGIKGNKLLEESRLNIDKSGRLPVNKFLQVDGLNHVYSAGDCALFFDPKTNNPLPQTGQIAKDQGVLIGKNIAAEIQGKNLESFKMKNYGYIIPLKGRFCVANLHFFILTGFFGWLLQQLVFLRYLLMILPLSKALKKWNKFELELKQE